MTAAAALEEMKTLSPMLCPSCKKSFQEPRLLPCLHSVCFDCLDLDKTRCPVCSGIIPPLPEIPKDLLVEYLMSNKQTLEGISCANCEQSHSIDVMLFCNTCSQPLCQKCRDFTHSAKMFAKHEIVDILSKRLNKQRMCSLHNEPFIMFNAEDKSLVCISCFREIGLSKRTHCLDIETAYSTVQNAMCKSIEYTCTTQSSLSELVDKIDLMITETKDSSQKRLEEIDETYSSITKAVELCKERLIEDCKEYAGSCLCGLQEKQDRLKLLLPVLQTTLRAADLFTSVSDRFDLVELGTHVIERLQALTSKVTQLQTLHISENEMLDYRKEFTECLGLTLADKKLPNTDKLHDSIRAELIAYHRGISRSSGPGTMYAKQLEQKSVHIDELHRLLNTYKNQVQELHRDITIRRSSAGANKTSALTKNCEELMEAITTATTELKQLQPLLENSWKETLNSVVKQQERYKDRMSVVEKMRNETQYLITLVKQLTPFIHNYKAVSDKLHPKLGTSSSSGPDGQSLDNMNQIIQTIKEIQPDSGQRIAAIELAEREKSGNKKSKNSLEEDLLKQKGKLRSVVNSSEDLSLL